MSDPTPFNPADRWEHLVRAGLSKADATRHVLRVVGNTPEEIQADYLKEVDPGKLASFGLGVADMASFGLGDQAARAIWGKEATDTQQAAKELHPTAHLLGEAAGLVGPAAVEYGLAKLGVLAPTAIGAAVRGIKNLPARAVAKTAVNAATGAGYAAAQAAGRTEGGLGVRAEAAQRAAVPGAMAGIALPLGAATLGAAVSPIMKRLAGPVAGMSARESALAMGAGGPIPAPVAGKLVSKLAPIGATVAKNALRLAKKLMPDLATADAEAIAEAAYRAEIQRALPNIHPKVLERAVQAWKTGKVPQGAIDLPPMEPTVSRVGETITPLEPQLPTLRAQADVMATQPAYVRAGNPNNLPTGTGPMAPPQAGMPLGVPGTLQALEQHLGRPLTPPETQSVLERLLGPPGTPIPRSYGRPP